MRHKIMVALNGVMALLFLFAAVVQYNDPDNLRWILIYGGAALSSILWLTQRYNRILPAIVLVVALVWMAFLLPDVLGHDTFNARMFESFKMNDIGVEEAREVGGLGIIALWMVVITFIQPDKIKKGF